MPAEPRGFHGKPFTPLTVNPHGRGDVVAISHRQFLVESSVACDETKE